MVGTKRLHKGSGIVISDAVTQRKVQLFAGIDAGSTETRVCLADKKDAKVFVGDDRQKALDLLMTSYSIPSTYATIADARELTPVSENLEDNYDSNVILVSCDAAQPLLGRQRVIRGRKISDAMGLVPMYLDSSTNKMDNAIFYTNIIDALGYAIMQKYNGQIPAEVEVYLSLSVRPKELTTKCKEIMRNNLLGSFMFVWKGMFSKVSMSITIAGLDFTTEPEAEIEGTLSVCDLRAEAGINPDENTQLADQLADSSCFIHIEGGGSSIGVEVLRNRKIIDACSNTFQLGGNYLSQLFIDRYREETGRTVTKDVADNAIISCTLRDGRNILDVAEIVAQCKDQVGQDILERLRHNVIDVISDLTLRDVEFITLGGRLFLPDGAGNTIATFFGEYVQQISQHTEIIVLPENFIAQGNLLSGMSGEFASVVGVYDNAPSAGYAAPAAEDGDNSDTEEESGSSDLFLPN